MTVAIAMNGMPVLRGTFAACLMLTGAALAQSQAPSLADDPLARLEAQLEQATADQLKAIYVDCSSEAEQRLLGTGEAMACSVVYETLKRRVFGGDFDALFAWSRTQRTAQASDRGASPIPASRR
jgi:hypothetical protein